MAAVSLLLMYYRSFSYLRVIDLFTTLIGIINVIIIKLLAFFFVLIYLYVATALVMIKLNPEQTKAENFEVAYVWSFFGGIGGEDFKEFKYSTIAILFGTLLITIVLLNVLIAYLSNLFSRLEEQQYANDLKEKASLILDLEIVAYFFRYKMSGNLGKYSYLNEIKEIRLCTLDKKKIDVLVIH